MIISTTESIVGKKVTETLGLVSGNVIRARNIGSDVFASVRNVVGGEVKSYTKLMTDSRNEAIQRMIQAAEALNADAVIVVRFSTSTVISGAAEILAYGTAVKLA